MSFEYLVIGVCTAAAMGFMLHEIFWKDCIYVSEGGCK